MKTSPEGMRSMLLRMAELEAAKARAIDRLLIEFSRLRLRSSRRSKRS